MIPLEMTSAEEIPQIKKGIEDIWNHLKRYRSLSIEASDYQSVIDLVFRELINTFTRVIDKLSIMDVSYTDFIKVGIQSGIEILSDEFISYFILTFIVFRSIQDILTRSKYT